MLQGLKFDVIPSNFEENLDKSAFKHPYEYVLENSRQKALEVADRTNKVRSNIIVNRKTEKTLPSRFLLLFLFFKFSINLLEFNIVL